jgi:hypothetical protein
LDYESSTSELQRAFCCSFEKRFGCKGENNSKSEKEMLKLMPKKGEDLIGEIVVTGVFSKGHCHGQTVGG